MPGERQEKDIVFSQEDKHGGSGKHGTGCVSLYPHCQTTAHDSSPACLDQSIIGNELTV